MKDPFESIRRMQEISNRIYGPIMRYQAQIDAITKSLSPMLLEYQQQIDKLALISSSLSFQTALSPALEAFAKQQELINSLHLPTTLGKQFQNAMSSVELVLNSPFINNQVSDPFDKLRILERVTEKVDSIIEDYNIEFEEPSTEEEESEGDDELASDETTLNWLRIATITLRILVALATFVATYPQLKDGVQEILDDLSFFCQIEEHQAIQDADTE